MPSPLYLTHAVLLLWTSRAATAGVSSDLRYQIMFLAISCRVSEELDSQDPASSGEDEKGAHDDENNVVNRE